MVVVVAVVVVIVMVVAIVVVVVVVVMVVVVVVVVGVVVAVVVGDSGCGRGGRNSTRLRMCADIHPGRDKGLKGDVGDDLI